MDQQSFQSLSDCFGDLSLLQSVPPSRYKEFLHLDLHSYIAELWQNDV